MSGKQKVVAVQLAGVAKEWLDDDALEPMVEINAQCLELLCGMAAAQPAPLAMLRELQPLWRCLSLDGRQQLSRTPYLLVDAGFGDEVRWANLQRSAVQDVPRELRAGCFAGERAAGLVRRALVYGWHLARAQPTVARVVLGISPACLARLASLRLWEIDVVCEQHPGWIRPRWESQPLVWRQMLTAALNADAMALRQAGLRGIQLLAAEAYAAPLRA
jgi:hypothetical protein